MKNEYQLAVRAAFVVLALTAAFALNTTALAQSRPVSAIQAGGGGITNTGGTASVIRTSWYNGDFNGVNGLANEQNTTVSQASVYDDFIVSGPGWNVASVFSDNLANTVFTGASWEIRSGVSEGNGGTLVASGIVGLSNLIVTPTGRSGFGFTEYMVQVTGLNLYLAPGMYWLNVTPTGNGTGRSFDSTTSGANCVGTPCGNDQNAFFNSTFFGTYFTSTANVGQPGDFSMGVIYLVPEPAMVALLTLGLGALLITLRRRSDKNLAQACPGLIPFPLKSPLEMMKSHSTTLRLKSADLL
jgi:hypothetical protein